MGDAMKRRSRAGREPIKGRRQKAAKPTPRNAPKAPAKPNSFSAVEETKFAQLTRELSEVLEREAATSEVLQVISGSPGDLQPVFQAMLKNAVRLCDASFGSLYRWDGDALHLIATHNTPPAFAEYRKHTPLRPGPTSASGQPGLVQAARDGGSDEDGLACRRHCRHGHIGARRRYGGDDLAVPTRARPVGG